MKVKGGKWALSDVECLQLTKSSAVKLAEIQLELKRLRKENALLKDVHAKYKERDTVWKERERLWKERLRLTEDSAKKSEERVLLWRKKFDEQRVASTPWYTHPVFVAVTTAAVTAGVFYLATRVAKL